MQEHNIVTLKEIDCDYDIELLVKSINDNMDDLHNQLEKKLEKFNYNNNLIAGLILNLNSVLTYIKDLPANCLSDYDTEYKAVNMNTDHFVNNIYRIIKSTKTLLELINPESKFKFDLDIQYNLDILLDIRTLIAHAGERTKLNSNKKEYLVNWPDYYNNQQLERITNKYRKDPIDSMYIQHINYILSSHNIHSDFDYVVTVWTDTKLKYKDDNVLLYILSHQQIKNTLVKVLESAIDQIINEINTKKDIGKVSKIHGNISNIVDKQNHEINYKIIINQLRNQMDPYRFNKKGQYSEEDYPNDSDINSKNEHLAHWPGFGLLKLYNYVKRNKDEISNKVSDLIIDTIENRVICYINEYNNYRDDHEPIISLSMFDVFSQYIRPFKNYDFYLKTKLNNSYMIIHQNDNVDNNNIIIGYDIELVRSFLSNYEYTFQTDINNIINKDQSILTLEYKYIIHQVELSINKPTKI